MSTKLRLTVVVWVLWAWVVVGFAGGIAHADDTSPPAGDSTSAGPPASKDSKTDPDADPNRKPDTEKPDRPAPESPTDENTATAEETDTDPDPPTGAVAPPTADPAPDATADPPDQAPVVIADPKDPASEATEDTKDPAPDSRRSSLHHDVTKQSPTPTKPIAAEPRTPAGDATSHRSSAPIEQPPAQTSSRTLQTLTVAPSGPSAPISQPGTDTQNLPQLGRQVVGLVSDIGTVVMSAVYTVADTVAKAFGPDSFFGVPYALATAVANSAAAVSRTLIGAPDYMGTGRFPVNYGIINGLTLLQSAGRAARCQRPADHRHRRASPSDHSCQRNGCHPGGKLGSRRASPRQRRIQGLLVQLRKRHGRPQFPDPGDGRHQGVRAPARRRSGQGSPRNGCTQGDTHRPFAGRRNPACVLHQQHGRRRQGVAAHRYRPE